MKKKALRKSIESGLSSKQNEPIFDSSIDFDTAFCQILSWYSYNKDPEDSKKYLLDYVKDRKKSDIELIDKNFSKAFLSRCVGFLSRIVKNLNKNNLPVPKELEERLSKEIEVILSIPVETKKKQEQQQPVKIQDRIKEQRRAYLSEIDFMIDEYICGVDRFKELPNFYDVFQTNNIKSIHIDPIIMTYSSDLEEIVSALTKSNSYNVEAYSNFTKKQLKLLEKMYNHLFSEANRWRDVSKEISSANKKPRKIKEKSPSDQVKKLIYLAEYEKFKSIAPEKVVGSDHLYVYNTKTKKLFLYKASASRGFQVKGSTLLSFDEKESFGKTLRKPVKMLDEVNPLGKIASRKFLEDIKGKSYGQLTGRINKDTILLKVF